MKIQFYTFFYISIFLILVKTRLEVVKTVRKQFDRNPTHYFSTVSKKKFIINLTKIFKIDFNQYSKH